MTPKELTDAITALPLKERLSLLNSLSDNANLGPQERAFLNEYVRTMEPGKSAKRAGYFAPNNAADRLLNTDNEVAAAAIARVTAAEEQSQLDAVYVRKYLKDVLDLCPTDYFLLGADGEWMIDPVQFRSLPVEVKRLVDGTEVRRVGQKLFFSVQFVSKQVALALAARYTLAKADQKSANDQFFRALMGVDEDDGNEAIERRIAAVHSEVEERSGTPRVIPLAEDGALQQTA